MTPPPFWTHPEPGLGEPALVAKNDGAWRQNDSKRSQTRGIDQRVPRDAPGTPPTALLRSWAGPTAPGASYKFCFFLSTFH